MTNRDRRHRPTASKPVRPVARAVVTADEYRVLIQKFVDQARSDQSIAERLAEETRLRFGTEIDAGTETE